MPEKKIGITWMPISIPWDLRTKALQLYASSPLPACCDPVNKRGSMSAPGDA
jgi:hypothetical protein